MTLTETINGIKQGKFKFDKLKEKLQILDGLLDGAYVVKPKTYDARKRFENTLEHDVTHETRGIGCNQISIQHKNYETVNTESLKELLNEIKEIL